MKIRGTQLVLGVVVLLVVGVVAYCASRPAQDTPSLSSDDFLKVAEQKARGISPAVGVGTLPPANGDPNLVPKLVLDPSGVLEVGTIPNDKMGHSEFRIYNRGKADLVINAINTTCACTVAEVDEQSKIIPPGHSVVAKVTIDPTRIPGFESRKVLTVTSNDASDASIKGAKLEVHALVTPEFALDPPQVDFGQLRKGAPQEKTVIMRQLGEEPIGLKEVKAKINPEAFTASFVKRPENEWAQPGKAEFLITIRLLDTIAPGALNGACQLHVECKRFEYMNLPVKADVQSFYTREPANGVLIVHSVLPPNQAEANQIKIVADKPVEVVDLQCTVPELAATVVPGTQPGTVFIKFALAGASFQGQRVGEVTYTLKTQDESVRESCNLRVIGAGPTQKLGPNPGPTPSLPPVPGQPEAGAPAPAPPLPPAPGQPDTTAPAPAPAAQDAPPPAPANPGIVLSPSAK